MKNEANSKLLDKQIILLLLVLFLSNTIYGLGSPFLPQVFVEKGISHTWTGVIFSSYAVATIFTSLFIG